MDSDMSTAVTEVRAVGWRSCHFCHPFINLLTHRK